MWLCVVEGSAITMHHGLLVQQSNNSNIIGFNDSDCDNDIDITYLQYCVYYGSNIVSSSSHKHKYCGIVGVRVKIIIWLTSLLSKLHIVTTMSNIYSDNLGEVLLNANPIMHSKQNI